jgi:hypothetical protein
MTTRLVVVMRDAGNLGSQDAQTCRVPAHVRGVTASYSPPPRVPLRWRNFYARHFRARGGPRPPP